MNIIVNSCTISTEFLDILLDQQVLHAVHNDVIILDPVFVHKIEISAVHPTFQPGKVTNTDNANTMVPFAFQTTAGVSKIPNPVNKKRPPVSFL